VSATVGVVVDSAASLPAEVVAEAGLQIVPLLLTVGERHLEDGAVGLEDVVADPEGFSSSGPTPGQFLAAIEAADRGAGVVVLTVAHTMSSTFDAARLAVQDAGDKAAVVDTGTAAGAEGLVALAAASAARRGASLAEVVAVAERARDRVRLVATLSDMEHLRRSGRVPEIAARAGRWLKLHPVFEFVDGAAHPLVPGRSRAAALDRILDRWRSSGGGEQEHLHVAALHALDVEPAEELLARVAKEVTPATAFVAPFSAVMVGHTGPGLVGLSWWWEPAEG
jgi:DegV family protein with EDD domain